MVRGLGVITSATSDDQPPTTAADPVRKWRRLNGLVGARTEDIRPLSVDTQSTLAGFTSLWQALAFDVSYTEITFGGTNVHRRNF